MSDLPQDPDATIPYLVDLDLELAVSRLDLDEEGSHTDSCNDGEHGPDGACLGYRTPIYGFKGPRQTTLSDLEAKE